jgi:hypothetical protein
MLLRACLVSDRVGRKRAKSASPSSSYRDERQPAVCFFRVASPRLLKDSTKESYQTERELSDRSSAYARAYKTL